MQGINGVIKLKLSVLNLSIDQRTDRLLTGYASQKRKGKISQGI